MNEITPKLEKIMERAWERFVASRGIPIAGKFTRLLMGMDREAWHEWLSERGITRDKRDGTIPCWDPSYSPEWPVKLYVPEETAMKIVTLEDLP